MRSDLVWVPILQDEGNVDTNIHTRRWGQSLGSHGGKLQVPKMTAAIWNLRGSKERVDPELLGCYSRIPLP